MNINHGVFTRGIPPDHVFEFWWYGEKISIEDFNSRFLDQTKALKEGVDDFLEGFKTKESINEGSKTVAKIDQIEDILKLPLCQNCRSMIGGDVS